MKKVLYAACLAALACACKKDASDVSRPVITLLSPTNQQSFTAGQTVTISATITDNEELRGVHVYVRNKATSVELLHVEEHTNLKTYNLVKTFTAQAGITYKIELEATDHADNQGKVELEVMGK